MALVADILVCAAGLFMVGAFTWALRGHFVSTAMPTGAKIVTLSVAISTVIFLFLTLWETQPLWAQVSGLLLQGAGGWMFFATVRASRNGGFRYAFDYEAPGSLVDKGPYGWVRHPFYVSYLIFWAGWAIATWSAWTVPILLLLLALYIVAATGEERNFSRSEFAGAYAEYSRRVGFFWPRLR